MTINSNDDLLYYILKLVIPGKNPGTSTKVTRGMLKASQNRTNLAPFTDELISKHPSHQIDINIYQTAKAISH